MRQSWMRNILLFSVVMLSLASCKDPEFSLDEPLTPPDRKAIFISGNNNFLYALDPNSGEKIWEKFFGINKILQEPIILQNYTIVNTDQGIIRLNAASGKLVDTIHTVEFNGAKHRVTGMISGENNTIITGTTSSHLIGYNMDAKAVVWVGQYAVPTAMNSTGSYVTNKYLANFDNKLHMLNKAAGNQAVWTYTLPGDINDPVVAPPFVYVLEKSGNLHCLDINSGVQLWTYSVGAPTLTAPVVYGENILFGSDNNNLYCIDPIAQAPRWVYTSGERIQGSVYAYKQSVYFGSFDNYVYALNIIDGEFRWRYKTGGLIKSSPIVTNDMVYIAGYDMHMYAFDVSGLLKWKYKINALIDMSPVANNLDGKPVYPAVSGMSTQEVQ